MLGIWVSEKISCHGLLNIVFILVFAGWLIVAFYFSGKPSYRYRYFPGLLFMVFMFLFGVEWFHIREAEIINSSSPVLIKGFILSYEGETPKSIKYKIRSEALEYDSGFIAQKFTGLLYLKKNSAGRRFKPGQELYVSGRLIPFDKPANPYSFDYSGYLVRERISFRVWTTGDRIRITGASPVWSPDVLTGKIRNKISRFYEANGIRGDELAVLKAMFLGDRSDLLQEFKHSFSSAGVMHLLAVSGLHLGIIYLMLIFIFRPVRNERMKKYRVLTVLIVLWGYAFLTGLSPSVFRSAIMFSLVEAGTLLKRHSPVYNQLLASILIIVLIEPYSVYKAGFWLSHAAVAGIVYFYPLINNLITFDFILFRWLWSLISVSVSAQIGTFALSIYYFHMFPVYFILGNVLLVPLLAPALILAFVLALISFLPVSGFSLLFAGPLRELIRFMIDVTRLTEKLPGAVIQHISLSPFQMFIIALLIVSIVIYNYELRKTAVFTIIVSLILMVSSLAVEKIKSIEYSGFVVFSQRSKGIFNEVGYRNNTLVLTDSLKPVELEYVCGGYWAEQGAKEPEITVLKGKQPVAMLFKVAGKTILLLHDITKMVVWENMPKVDFVVLSGDKCPYLSRLKGNLAFGGIVLSTGLSAGLHKIIAKKAEAFGIPCYDVSSEGAWMYSSDREWYPK